MRLPVAIAALIGVAACACSNESGQEEQNGAAGAAGGGKTVDVSDDDFAQAAAKYPTYDALWANALYMTCGPNNGVCHQNKQFPHMEFDSSLIEAIDTPCNQLRNNPAIIANICEPQGDQIRVGSFMSRVAWVDATPAGAPTEITITLRDPIPPGTDQTSMAIVRKRPGFAEQTIPIPLTQPYNYDPILLGVGERTITLSYYWMNFADVAPGPPGTIADFLLPRDYVPFGDELQIEIADPNRDGVYGHDLGGALIKPGKPDKSYLLMRVMGPLALGDNELTSQEESPSKEAQMPIANTQYWDARHAVPALWCWIAGLTEDASNARDPIDYENCDRDAMPPLVTQKGEASTFSSVYEDVLVPRCSNCHSKSSDQPTQLFFDDPELTYSTLLGITGEGPAGTKEMPYVTKDQPEQSFLFLKLIGDPKAGARMPLGAGPLDDETIAVIRKWIEQGANKN